MYWTQNDDGLLFNEHNDTVWDYCTSKRKNVTFTSTTIPNIKLWQYKFLKAYKIISSISNTVYHIINKPSRTCIIF